MDDRGAHGCDDDNGDEDVNGCSGGVADDDGGDTGGGDDGDADNGILSHIGGHFERYCAILSHLGGHLAF